MQVHVHLWSFSCIGHAKPHFQCNTNQEIVATPPRFFNEPHLLHVLFVKVVPWHHLRILVKAPLSCDWKGRTASVQSFTLSHQATMKVPRRAHLISAYSHHMGVVLHAHFVRGESHIHHNANWEATTLATRLGKIYEMIESWRDKYNANWENLDIQTYNQTC